jgi:hypothetical protein
LIVPKRKPTDRDLDSWRSTAEGFLQSLTESDGKPTKLAGYQVGHLRDRSKFRAREKARGVGFSFICAAEALAKAHIRNDYTAIFVSMNLEEAIEKIRYANLLYETIPLSWRKKKVIDNRTSIEFADSTGRFRSRLISHPCKDPRGKHKADVYLDEFAHYGHKQRSIYVASVPIVSRGGGQLTIGSTPLAVGDLFHEIVRQERKKYPMFSRMAIPWWLCDALCIDVEAAGAEAPGLDTEERVERFARPSLADIYRSLDVAEFQQEYELAFLDESQTYFPYDLIFGCVSDELRPCEGVEKLLQATKGSLYAGFDVGRTRNTSELIVLEKVSKRLVYRYGRSFDRSRFQEQEASLRKMLKRSSRFKRLCVDRHGIDKIQPVQAVEGIYDLLLVVDGDLRVAPLADDGGGQDYSPHARELLRPDIKELGGNAVALLLEAAQSLIVPVIELAHCEAHGDRSRLQASSDMVLLHPDPLVLHDHLVQVIAEFVGHAGLCLLRCFHGRPPSGLGTTGSRPSMASSRAALASRLIGQK